MDVTRSAITAFDTAKKTATVITLTQLMSQLDDKDKMFWIHCDLDDTPFHDKINSELHLPDSINKLIHNPNPIAQMDESDNSITVKIQAPLDIPDDMKKMPTFVTLTIHLTERYCITFSRVPMPALNEFMQQYQKSLMHTKTPGFIMYVILNNVLTEYAKLIFAFEARSDELDYVSRTSHKNHYHMIMRVRKSVIQSKRYIAAIRDTLMRISTRTNDVISERCRKSMVDLYNHSQTLTTEAESEREILNGMLDQIDNSIMHRMSETMKVLTAYATIFMPPTLITGIYGMNFYWIPELSWKYGYFYALTLILGSGLILYFTFKRLKWF